MLGFKPNSKNISKKNKNKLDDAFKGIISNGDILARILRGNIDELGDMEPDEIKDLLELGADGKTVKMRDREYFSRREGKIMLDSAFNLRIPGSDGDVGVIIGVEGQGNPYPGYPLGKRAEYYVARMVSAQRKREFKGSDYGKLKKVYSIWCVLQPRENDRNTITKYTMKAENVHGKDRPMEKLDTFNIVFINVGNYQDGLPDALGICAAMFSNIEEEERKSLVKDNYNIELNDEELERLKDMSNLDQDRFNHGRDVGRAEGIAEEKTVSTEIAIAGVMSLMSLNNMSFDEAASRLAIPKDRLKDIEAEVRKRIEISS